jgi:GntR family transcriptional activator of glc operon
MSTRKNTPIYQVVARRLELLILDGTLTPGKKIPSERQLAEKLNVSRPLVREALKELRGRGVIDTQHGRGSFVAEMVPSINENSPLAHLFKDHPRTLFDLLEVRELLEGQAAYLAAKRGTEQDFYRITEAYKILEQPHRDADEARSDAQHDHAFHRVISEASHNPVLVHTLQSLSQLTLNSVLASVNNLYHRPAQRQQIDRHHRQIYNAILSRQAARAQRAASNHIREIYKSLKDIEQEEERLVRAEIWSNDINN